MNCVGRPPLVLLLSLALTVFSCGKAESKDEEGGEATPPRDLAAERAALVVRLNASYKGKGTAALDGDALVITSAQCGDPAQAQKVIAITKKAAAKLEIKEVRCKAPPIPTKEELVEVFNRQFVDIGATARLEDEGQALTLEADQCEKEADARRLLRDAETLSRKAGFARIRCGKKGMKQYELVLGAAE